VWEGEISEERIRVKRSRGKEGEGRVKRGGKIEEKSGEGGTRV